MASFLFEVGSGKPVEIEPFHFAIVGQTQFSGKTTLLKRLADWAVSQGFRVLIFDSKETEADYEGFGIEVPVVLRETTDSFVLIGLLESMFKRKLTPYYATLSRLTEGARNFDDIIQRARQFEATTRSSWLRDACRVLYDLLERLRAETSKVKTVQTLQLKDGINRMAINNFTHEAQQLIVKNAFEDALRIYKRNLIIIIDEAFKFLPEKYSSAATRAIMDVMTQGAKTNLYVFISTQFLAITDKDPLKACAVKFLGTQDHITEVKHTLDLIPEARGKFTPEQIMKLKLGHWILVRKNPPYVGVVYSLPLGVPEHIGVEVAKGLRTPESIRDAYLKPKIEVDDEMWKEKYLELERKFADMRTSIYNELRKEFEAKVKEAKDEAYREAMQKLDEIRKQWNIDEYQQTIARLKDEKAALEIQLKQLEPLKAFGEAFIKLLHSLNLKQTELTPSELKVNIEQPVLTVKVERKTLELTDKTTEGKIAIIYAEGKLPSDKWFTTTDVVNAFISHGWSRDPRIGPTLDKMCQWGFFEKHYAGKRPEYRLRIKPEEAKAKGLIKIT